MKTITLTFDELSVALIIEGLSELPAKKSRIFLNELERVIKEQSEPKKEICESDTL